MKTKDWTGWNTTYLSVIACCGLSLGAIIGFNGCDAAPRLPHVMEPDMAESITALEESRACPLEFNLRNDTGESRIIHYVNPNGTGVVSISQPSNSTYFWTSTESDCRDSTGGSGRVYKCLGTRVPPRVTVCQSGCSDVLECDSAADNLPEP